MQKVMAIFYRITTTKDPAKWNNSENLSFNLEKLWVIKIQSSRVISCLICVSPLIIWKPR